MLVEKTENTRYKLTGSICFLLIWLTIFMAFPFSIPQAYGIPYKVVIGITSVILILTLLFGAKHVLVDKTIGSIFLLQISVAAIWCIIHFDTKYLNFLYQLITIFLIYCCVSTYIGWSRFSSGFIKFMLISAIFSVTAFFLGMLLNIPYLYEFQNPDGRTAYNFIITFTNALYDTGSTKIMRPSAFFDEPGALAFYITVALLVNELTAARPKARMILMSCGVFTLSIAFYLILFLYALLFQKFKPKHFIWMFLALIGFASAFPLLDESKQQIIKAFTVDRITSIVAPQKNTEVAFQGDNRTDLVESSVEAVKESPVIGEGLSYSTNPESKLYGKFMGANIVGIFGIHGILGGLLFSLHVLYYAWVSYSRSPRLDVPKKCFLIYSFLILQRPDFIGGILTYIAVLLLITCTKNFNRNGEYKH